MKTIYYAIQNIIRGKDSTLIKVVSLSLGLFFSIVMFALVGVQLGFDSFYRDHEDIYVAETAWDSGQGIGIQELFLHLSHSQDLDGAFSRAGRIGYGHL